MTYNTEVFYDGRVQYHLNSRFIEKQGLTEDEIEVIKALHIKKLGVFDQMKNTDDKAQLQALAVDVEKIEFQLQEAWGFPQNKNFHEWYSVPKCSCPKMDNADNKGTKYRIFSEDCIIHN